MGERRGVNRVLVGKPEEKRPLGRPRCKWVMDLQDVGCEDMEGIELAQDRNRWRELVNAAMNCSVSQYRPIYTGDEQKSGIRQAV